MYKYMYIYTERECVYHQCVCVGVPALHVQDHLVHIQSQRSLAGFWPTKYRSGCGSNATLSKKNLRRKSFAPRVTTSVCGTSLIFSCFPLPSIQPVHNNLRYIVFRYPTRASSRGATARSRDRRDRRKLPRLSEMHGKANLGWCFMVLPIVFPKSLMVQQINLDQHPS